MMGIAHHFMLGLSILFLASIAYAFYSAHRDQQNVRKKLDDSRLADETEIKNFIRFWTDRINDPSCAVIDLNKDKRTHLCGKKVKQVNWFAASQTFRRDVYDWSRSNLNAEFAFVPFLNSNDDICRIWFADLNDAMFFKMRWY